MSSTQWDKMGSVYKGTYPQYIPGAINNRIPFMLAKDAAANAPANPGDWNDTAETLRVKGLDALSWALTPVSTTFEKIDEATDGGFSRLMSAGYKNLRSNYAYTRDIGEKNAALGILSGLFTVTGAVLGGMAGFAIGGPVGAAAGASVGGAVYGTLQRRIAETEFVEKKANQLYRSAKLAETAAGQENYNFGRDIVGFTSSVTGWKTLGDTSKGIGAITSGLLNFGFELSASPDIGLAKGVGAVARRNLIAPIDETAAGLVSGRLSKKDAIESAKRLEATIDKIKRTEAGEVTEYTPLFKFYRENSPDVVVQRPEFRGDIPQIAGNLVAGQSDQVISSILRIGLLDDAAIKELDTLSAAKLAEYTRVSDAITIAESGGLAYVSYKGQLITASGLAPTGLSYLKKEMDSLKKEVAWFNDVSMVKGALAERTVSKWSWVERVRNDLAKERAARKFERSKAGFTAAGRTVDDLQRETTFGGVIQTIYQRGPFSVFVRMIDRMVDDAPRGTVNFNDRLLASDRFRANIRGAVRFGAIQSDDGIKLYNDFIGAIDETTKYNILQDYTKKLADGLGKKYDLPSMLVEAILLKYDKEHRTVLNAAREAQVEGRAYMIAPNGDTIYDPQLISQLANGSYLPNPKLWDKAFKAYKNKYGIEGSLPMKAGITTKFLTDEFYSLWRGFTLLRAGYPVNIIRDSAIRMLGDGALFPALKILSTDFLQSITNTSNTASKVKSALGPVNPQKNLENIREDVYTRSVMAQTLEKVLKEAGVDVTLPITKVAPEFQTNLKHLNDLKATIAALRTQENAIIAKTPPVPRVSKDSIVVQGYDFPHPIKGGKFAEISMSQLRMKDDMRRALTSIREVEAGNLRRSRTGGRTITPIENEQLHLSSWAQILKDRLGNDVVAEMIMKGESKASIVRFLRTTQEGQNYLARMGDVPGMADEAYIRVAAVIKQFAPTAALQKMILDGDVSIDNLRRLFPDVNQRPVVLTDLVDDPLGWSTPYQKGKELLQNGVAWLATAPTTKLMYAPYFAFKYQHKLQKLVHLANIQGKKLTLKEKQEFERIARSYAIGEYRAKLNSFHREMNFPGIFNYVIAFFPAIVEQFRAYGKITLDHPDFLLKAYAIKTLPERVFEVQEDPISKQEYVEVDLPILGLKGRLPVDWFNPFNPTGSTLIGASPLVAANWNEFVKRAGGESAVEQKITNWILPFGAQANSVNALLPNSIRRISQAVYAALGGGGGPSQFNKDVNMFMRQALADYTDQYHRNPTAIELGNMVEQSEDRALLLSTLRIVSTLTSPAQPRFVTALQPFADELTRMREADPINGEDDFIARNPDLFFLADSLSNSLAGLRSDDTAVSLVKRNPDMVKDLVSIVGEENLSLLGAIFNDDNYAFSSKAQAYLESSKVPFINKAFKEYGAPLEGARNSIIGKGWRDWERFIETVRQEVRDGDPSYNPNRGYGAQVVDYYKDQYLAKQREENPLWYDEYIGGGGYGNNRQNRLIDSLTYALNNDKMWKDLSQNPRWYAVIQYMNFRYDVNAELNRLGTTYDSNAARYLREDVADFVDTLKRQSPDFGLFYERYFSNDKFDYVYGG